MTPAILTLSKFVWPSTSKSPFASILPVNVETPDTVKVLDLTSAVDPDPTLSATHA